MVFHADYNKPSPMGRLFAKPRRSISLPLILLLALGFLLGLAAICIVLAPRVSAFQPAMDQRTGSYAAIEVRFSAAMDPACTESHFQIEPAVEGDLTVQGNTLLFVPEAPWPAGALVRVTLRRGACSRRGLPLLADFTWSFTPSVFRVAYVSSGNGSVSLRSVSADGGDPAELVHSAAPIQDFQISPRGDFLVYSTGSASGPGKIWIDPLPAGPPELLVDCGADACRDPVISPDGSLVAYERAKMESGPSGSALPRNPSIELVALGDRQTRVVSPGGVVASNPTWAPTGWLSYFDTARLAITVDDLHGGTSFIPNATGETWVWLPDGTGVIFPEITMQGDDTTSRFSSAILSRLILVTLKTNERRNLSAEAQIDDSSPAFSPDGRTLAFSRNFFDSRWTPGRQLWILNLEDSSARALTQTPDFSHSSIHWSPDGSRLVFMRFHETNPSDPPEIWCMNADGSGARLLATGGFLPQWLP
jgi:Tol biopolymer transport system component